MDSSFVWNINGMDVNREALSASPRNKQKRVYILPSGRKLKVVINEDIDDEYLIIESLEEYL